ncbi:MAG TPA: hypothetical protein VMU33_19755 [Burkholderiaceae bacterium]|nr:hypothetical protein [Burkholderiaceae bacterium]
MALFLSIAHTLLSVAFFSMLGQLAVGLFNWKRRKENVVYLLFATVTRPVIAPLRRLVPSRVGDAVVGVAAFLLVACAYLGAGYAQQSSCVADPHQSGCTRWLAARGGEAP